MLASATVLQSRYRIIRQIGGGGQALVYLAEDTNLGDLRAIKELTHDPNASPQERQTAYDQFQREARVLARLNHPNLARVWDHFRVGDNAYLIMDYIEGQTLQEILDQTAGFLPEAAVQRWAGQLCDVLDYLHRQHPPIIFRDLKPSNVMLDRSDTVKLIDFGIVRHFKAGQTADTVSMGTPGYAPLEQHGQGQTDARSDIYALGATLYHLVTRHEPEPAPARVLPGQPDPLQPARVHNPKTRPATEAALAKAMAVDPVQRFRSTLEMKRALMGAVSAPTPTVTIPRPAARRRIELRWPLLGLAALFVVLVWFLMGRGEPGPRPTPTVASAVVLATNTAIPMPTPTVAPTLTPEPPTPTKPSSAIVPERELIWEKDGSIMVHVPVGEFLMGSKDDPDAADDEHPQHTVYVSEFWIDKTEATNAQYRNCVEAGACRAPTTCDLGDPTYSDLSKTDHPVVCVSWQDAKAYCEWAGKRLPTEAEWEKAARGTDGRKYPWGDAFDCQRGNFDDETEIDSYVVPGGKGCDGYVRTAPVGSFASGASPYGVLDMAGNVWEWCQDWYDEDYYASSPQHDPEGPSSGSRRVVRGGSWRYYVRFVRAALRLKAVSGDRNDLRGFRCVSQSPLLSSTVTPTAIATPTTMLTPTPTVTPTPTNTPTATAMPTPTPTPAAMVHVPTGEFLMGSKDDPDANDDEYPHTVYVSEFWIDKTEVTNEQYRQCVETGTCRAPTTCDWGEPTYSDSSKADHPVVCVFWEDARTYCEWAGKRLPTEAEWEKASRGMDGRKYPWGDSFVGSKVNFCDVNCEFDHKDSGADDGYQRTAPAGSYPEGASPYGALDMAGNVWEWCQDWYDADYYAISPQRDPQGPSSGEYRVVRGGSWNHYERGVRAALRYWSAPDARDYYLGFRCVSQSP